MSPALIVIAIYIEPNRALVINQIDLSFVNTIALAPLVLLTRRRDVMGVLVNRRLTTVTASIVAALIISLNVFLLWQTFAG